MADAPDIKALQEQVFDLVKRSQDAVLEAGRSFTDGVTDIAPGDTSAVDDLIDRAFDLTERVLHSQRELAKSVLQAVTKPLLGDADKDAGKDAGKDADTGDVEG